MMQLGAIEQRLLALQALPADSVEMDEVLHLAEETLCRWIDARGDTPTDGRREGFRLLALHRQGAKGDPSFNACRESCRELLYHYNVAHLEPARRARSVAMALAVAYHLCLFIAGKLDDPAVGDFCCSSRPLRSESA